MFPNLLIKSKKIITDFFQSTYTHLKKRDVSSLIDNIFIMSVAFVILFAVLYKAFTGAEFMIWHTHYLIIPDVIKNSLPQLYFYFLIILLVIKAAIYLRYHNDDIVKKSESNKIISFKIPFFKKQVKISKTSIYTILLIITIILFFIIKIKYWDFSFTVNQPMKYSTYAEPAMEMYKHHDPLYLQRRYMHNPLTDSQGRGVQFGNFPILEWLLYIGYSLMGGIFSLEFITRFIMCIVGAVALITIFDFLRRIFNYRIAIIASFLLAINPIFNLASFVTVYDTIDIAITFGMLSLIWCYKKNSESNLSFLITAGLLLGFGASIKENIYLWAIPIALIFILFNKKNWTSWLTQSFILGIFSLLPPVLTHFSINFFPTKELKYFLIFIFGIAAIYLASKLIQRYYQKLYLLFDSILKLFNRHKILDILPILIVIGGIYLVYQTSLSDEFLTDWRLLFNADLYFEFIEAQLFPYCTIYTILLAVFGGIYLFVRKGTKWEILVILGFLISSAFYAIVASKVLFFHSYYWLFIIISVTILASVGLDALSSVFRRNMLKAIFLITILISLGLPVISGTRSKLNRQEKNIYDLVNYINEETFPNGTSFIDQGDLTYLSFKTNLYRVYDSNVFGDERFRSYVKEYGLAEAMNHFKIKYLITTGGTDPDYLIFANTFSKDQLASTSYRRTDQIYAALYPTKYQYYPNLDFRNQILKDNNIEAQFYIVKDFGNYTIYGLTPACFNVVIE